MQVRALVCRSVWSAALVGSLLAGCGGETGANSEASESSEAEAVFEGVVPAADERGAAEDAPGATSAGQVHAAALSCPSGTATWTQQRTAWNSNVNTAGTYSCSASVPGASHGSSVSVQASGSERTGSAQLRCDNGTWLGLSVSCDGKVVSAMSITGASLVCSSPDPVRTKWIGWYVADYKRCADTDGLEWWVYQYNNNTDCLASTNYNGYGTKDACWRAQFVSASPSLYSEAQSTGHIASSEEFGACGPNAAYPWSNVLASGTLCKYKP